MPSIRKKIIRDENSRPVAVQIDWADWLEVESALSPSTLKTGAVSLERYAGTISLTEDPLAFQERLRGEWS
jgi:hypothetical protein